LIKEIFRINDIPQKNIKPKKILGLISLIKDQDLELSFVKDYDGLKKIGLNSFEELKILKFVYQEYVKRLRTSNYLDFSDLINLTHELLLKHQTIREK